MNCTQTKIMDIEEINTHTDIPELFDIYSQIIHSLLNWVNNYNSNIEKMKPKFANELHRLERKQSSNKKLILRKNILINVFRKMLENKTENITKQFNKNTIDTLKLLLQKKPSRNISGITSITLLTSPHPNGQKFSCSHNCYYCPNEPAHEGNNFQEQPRSYLYNEPAVKRANDNKFLAINQMLSRLNTLLMNGHEIDKLEIILEGGTYTEYPPDYLEEFNRDIFFIANTYFDAKDPTYIQREPLSIAQEIEINKTATVHIIGVCIETRPDAIDDIWIRRFRNWGITRIQIGVQHTDNTILKKINRGHTIEQAMDCMKYLKDNCFKIDIHMMPDLPYSTPEMDKQMFDYVYTKLHPDQMKIYPCEITPWTIIEKWYKSGKYVPYSEICMRDLFEVVKYGMEKCPAHIRLPRVIRDIPISYIMAGNPHANLRQMIDHEFEKENKHTNDIRSREIGRHLQYYKRPAEYTITKFEANDGIEFFIQYQSLDKKALFGFIRLRFPSKDHNPVFPCLKNKALIRELHVYGSTNIVGKTSTSGAQHTGIGSKLLKMAERIAIRNFYSGIVVISGEGVKEYYSKRGYQEVDTFMVKNFYDINKFINMIYIIINISYILWAAFVLYSA
jgi:ELP3 family radical SAM enzyme/protein acetyltransferase